MNVATTVKKHVPTLVSPIDVQLGQVYSWGEKAVSYLRVFGGSVCLSNWDFISTTHPHFKEGSGPSVKVEVADKADLTITYEG